MPATPEPKVGEIWIVDFNPQVGREQAGIRPGLVVSSDWFNDTDNGLHIVCPLTTVSRGLDYHIAIQPPEGGITRRSLIMCEQQKSQSVQRFRSRRGVVSPETLARVRRMIETFMSD